MSLLSQRIRSRLEEAKASGTKLTMDAVEQIIVTEEDQLAQLNESAATAPKKLPKAYIDSLFDALALVQVQGGNPAEITKSQKAQIAVARKEIMEVTTWVTPDEIAKRAALYKRRWPTWTLSATSLSKHWAELGPAIGKTASARADIYQQPTFDWKPIALKVTGLSEFPEAWSDWLEIPSNWRVQILQNQ